MDDRITGLLGLINGGKRVYQVKEGEVERADFEYCAVIAQVLWSDKGLVDTLGPTWEMVHDPRFETIERQFIVKKRSKTGGDPTVGLQRQNADGFFEGSFAGIEQYTEVLGEGRLLIDILRSRAILDAVATLYPDRVFETDPNDSTRGLKLIETLTPVEKEAVLAVATTNGKYKPHDFKDWPETDIWALIRDEYTNYFTRAGKPNPTAVTLFRLIQCDLTGLIADYAEVANIQEWVLLEDPNELYDPAKHGEEAARVWAEVEILERALSYRAELRVTAARLLDQLNIGEQAVGLTDAERDDLLKIIYQSNYPEDVPELLSNVLSFLTNIRVSGKSIEERQATQLGEASVKARAYVRSLIDGTVQPINRNTEEVVEQTDTPEGLLIQRVLHDPIALHVFLRLESIERRIEATVREFTGSEPEEPGDSESEAVLAYLKRLKLANQWIEAAENVDYHIALNYEIPPEDRAILHRLELLVKARVLLAPIFEKTDYQWTDEGAEKLLAAVEVWDPTPQLGAVPEADDDTPTLTDGSESTPPTVN